LEQLLVCGFILKKINGYNLKIFIIK
jgi:hypothetical protein